MAGLRWGCTAQVTPGLGQGSSAGFWALEGLLRMRSGSGLGVEGRGVSGHSLSIHIQRPHPLATFGKGGAQLTVPTFWSHPVAITEQVLAWGLRVRGRGHWQEQTCW